MAEYTKSQLKAINIRDKNILVSASAGTGKTHAMIKRVVELIMGRRSEEINGETYIFQDENKRISIDRILLMTFTKAAAAEMKVRLHTELTRELHSCNQTDVKEYLIEQIDLIPMCNISTIDAFCANLLRSYFQELGISPLFEVADEDDDRSYQSDAIQIVLEDDKYKEQLDRLRLIFSDKMKDDNISNIIINIYKWAYSTENPEDWLKRVSISQYNKDIEDSTISELYFKGIRRDATIIVDEISKLHSISKDKEDYANWLVDVSEIFTRYSKVDNFKDLLKIPITIAKAPQIRGDKSLGALKKALKNLIDEFFKRNNLIDNKYDRKQCNEDIQELRQVVKDVIDLTLTFSDQYSDNKLKDNKLTFNDLEHYTVKLLDNEDLKKEISDRFDYVLVDEYQDINHLQELIISRIAKSNNLFMVGDPKQSIYRFRQAIPEIFLDKEKEYSETGRGETASFTVNFRSRKAILDYVNLVFSRVMTQDFGEIDYARKAMLAPPKDLEHKYLAANNSPAVSVLTYKSISRMTGSKETLPIYSVREHNEINVDNSNAKIEARIIYNKIKELEGTYYYDIKTNTSNNKINYRDMAILFRNRSENNMMILDYLREWGIPLNDSTFIKSDTSKEIKLIINLLRVIDNDNIEIPLVSIMRSFFGGFSDQELVDIKLLSDDYNLPYYMLLDMVKEKSLKDKIKKFRDFIIRMRLKCNYMSVFDLLQEIIAETGFDRYCIAHITGEKLYDNLNNFIFSLKDKSYASSIGKYLHYYDNYIERVDSKSIESLMDAVTVSTMHGAKGLEYPVVFIANANTYFSNKNDKMFMIDRELGLCFLSYDTKEREKSKNIVYTVMDNLRKEKEMEDNLNLFYVSLTRAKNHLIITGSENKDGISCPRLPRYAKNFLEWAAYGINDNNYQCIDIEELDEIDNEILEDKELIAYFNTASKDYLNKMKKVLDYKYPYINSTKYGIKYSVSAINKSEDEIYVPELPSIRIEDRKAKGTLSHKVMEHIDLKAHSMIEIDDELNRLIKENILSQEELDTLDKNEIYKCLNSDIIRYASNNVALREKSFMLKIPASEIMDTDIKDEVLLQGTIDMLIQGKENILVDYKRTAIKDNNKIIDLYIRQIDLYTLAVERIMGIKIDKRIIYLFGRNEEIVL